MNTASSFPNHPDRPQERRQLQISSYVIRQKRVVCSKDLSMLGRLWDSEDSRTPRHIVFSKDLSILERLWYSEDFDTRKTLVLGRLEVSSTLELLSTLELSNSDNLSLLYSEHSNSRAPSLELLNSDNSSRDNTGLEDLKTLSHHQIPSNYRSHEPRILSNPRILSSPRILSNPRILEPSSPPFPVSLLSQTRLPLVADSVGLVSQTRSASTRCRLGFFLQTRLLLGDPASSCTVGFLWQTRLPLADNYALKKTLE